MPFHFNLPKESSCVFPSFSVFPDQLCSCNFVNLPIFLHEISHRKIDCPLFSFSLKCRRTSCAWLLLVESFFAPSSLKFITREAANTLVHLLLQFDELFLEQSFKQLPIKHNLFSRLSSKRGKKCLLSSRDNHVPYTHVKVT